MLNKMVKYVCDRFTGRILDRIKEPYENRNAKINCQKL